MTRTINYSILIPTFNSHSFIEETVARVDSVFAKGTFGDYEIIIIDDGSTDPETWKCIKRLCTTFKTLSAIRLTKNFGKHGALICGFSNARGKWHITIDDDLQQLPEDIPLLIEHNAHDVVIGEIQKKQHGGLVNLTSRVKQVFDRHILGINVKISPLKVINAKISLSVVESSGSRPFLPAMLAMATTDFFGVTIRHERGRRAKSSYSYAKRFGQFMNLLIGNSNFLLRFLGSIGALVATIGLIFGMYILLWAVFGPGFRSGWASIAVLNLIFGGLILVSLAINGEYLLRILENTRDQPPFVIKEKI